MGWVYWFKYLKDPITYTRTVNDSVLFKYMSKEQELVHLNRHIAFYRTYYVPLYGNEYVPLYVHLNRMAFITSYNGYLLAGVLYWYLLTHVLCSFDARYNASEIIRKLEKSVQDINFKLKDSQKVGLAKT